jgi:prophage regulatory protein
MAAATKTEVAQIGNPSVEVTPPPIINEVTLNMEILRMKQVSAHIGLGRSTIYAMLDPKSRSFVPSFPKPVRISNRSIGWPSQSITQYLIDREGA